MHVFKVKNSFCPPNFKIAWEGTKGKGRRGKGRDISLFLRIYMAHMGYNYHFSGMNCFMGRLHACL